MVVLDERRIAVGLMIVGFWGRIHGKKKKKKKKKRVRVRVFEGFLRRVLKEDWGHGN